MITCFQAEIPDGGESVGRAWRRERISSWDMMKLRCLRTVKLGTVQWTNGYICVELKRLEGVIWGHHHIP